jgi:hypothetical protein
VGGVQVLSTILAVSSQDIHIGVVIGLRAQIGSIRQENTLIGQIHQWETALSTSYL